MSIRALIVVLVALNLGVAAWWLSRPAASPPPVPVSDRGGVPLQVLSTPAVTATLAADTDAPTALAASPDAGEGVGEGAAPAPAAEIAARTCFRIGPFATRAAAEAARGRVDAVMPEPQLREEPGRASRYRVLLPPAEDRAQAQATAQRIAAAGFDDLFVLSQGAEANAIALGTYGSRETAQRRAAALQAAGFPAQVQAQGAAAASQWWWLGASDDAQAVRAAHPAAQALDCTALAAPALR